jgi:molecular chaperone IbpB/HSP20 family protein
MSNSYYGTFFNLFDDIFSESARFLELAETQPARFNKTVSSSQFPPSDVFVDTKTKKMTIKVALAGYSEENINLRFDGDYLKLTIDLPIKGEEESIEYVVQRGIKLPKHVEAAWGIDNRYYDRDSATVNYKDGLLTVEISPREEVAPKKIKLFGNLDLEKDEKLSISKEEDQ